MNDLIRSILMESAEVKKASADSLCDDIALAAQWMVESYRAGGKCVVFGNGGSAADAQHFAAELTGRFQRERSALPALALTVNTSTITSVANDYGYETVFVRQVEAFVNEGDVVVGISTSGKSPGVLKGLERARSRGAKVVGLTGAGGGEMAGVCDLCVKVPSGSTPRIQETHIAIIHIWCELVESQLFST